MRSPIIQRRRQRLIGSILLAVIILCLLVFFRGSVVGALHQIQRPFVQAGTWMSTHTIGAWVPDGDTISHIQTLEEQRNALSIDHARLAELERENAHLRKQLSFVGQRTLNTIGASIVSRTLSPISSHVAIDRGSADGIQVGDPVIMLEGILVGRVIAVREHSATVRALTDPQMAISVNILNEGSVIGIANGQSGSLLSLELIPQEARIEINNLIVTSGLDTAIPSGLVVGLVNAVESDPTQPFQRAIVEPELNLTHEHVVSVIIRDPV